MVLAQKASDLALIRHPIPHSYEVAENLGVGDEMYVDRILTITSLPTELEDAIWIKTKNADKNQTADDFLNFIVTQDAVVYVAYDKAATSLPDWMGGFIDTGHIILKSATGSFRVYAKVFVAGQVTLGANYATGAAGANTNYVVLAQKK